MKKKNIIILSVTAVIILLLIFGFISATSSSTVAAQVHVESGSVSVNGEQIQTSAILSENDVIETSQNGKATIILYESIIINLDPNTKLTVSDLQKDHPQLSQDKGSTWSTFTHLFGLSEYSIKDSNSVASVRGTAFYFSQNKLITGSGTVNYTNDQEYFEVKKDEVVDSSSKRTANPAELKLISEYNNRTIQELVYLRSKEIEKHPYLIKLANKLISGSLTKMKDGQVIAQRELTQEEIKSLLKKVDSNEISLEETIKAIDEKIPVRIKSLDKIIEITKKIKELSNQ